MNELNELIKASRKKEEREMKFFAAINGVDLDEKQEEPKDILDLKNSRIAQQEGFGIGEGLGFLEL